LTDILKLYETFQTDDARDMAKRQSSKIMKGSTVAVPHNLFRKLGKMSADFFDQVAVKITNWELSLKQAAEDYSKHSSRNETMACVIKQLPGYLSAQEIGTAFPEKFTSDVLDSFAESVIGEKGMNSKGRALQDYCKSVVVKVNSTPKAILKKITSFQEVDLSTVTGFDTMVINCIKLTANHMLQLKALKADNISMNIILLLVDQDVKTDLFCQLSTDVCNLKEIFSHLTSQSERGIFVRT
jgi:hypothetical protein